jgi:glycosyltransferase involved in cell wall biosynthesis
VQTGRRGRADEAIRELASAWNPCLPDKARLYLGAGLGPKESILNRVPARSTQLAPLRVLLISASHPPTHCGVGDYTARLATMLAARSGVQVGVLTTKLSTGVAHAARTYELMDVVPTWSMLSVLRLPRVISGWKPDLVHIQYPAQGYRTVHTISTLANLIRWKLRLPLVTTLHEHIDPKCRFDLPLIAASQEFIVVREQFRKTVCRGFGWVVGDKPFHLIPNTSNLPQAQRTPELMATVRNELGSGSKPIIAYFGFIQPSRGIELLFEIADPGVHHLAIVGGRLPPFDSYFDLLLCRTQIAPWKGSAVMTGFVPAEKAAAILAVADAVVLPFHLGAGSWSTSVHAAMLQGTFVLTTSLERNGYDPSANVCHVPPVDIPALRRALAQYQGKRHAGTEQACPSWTSIAARHEEIYRRLSGCPARNEAA